LEKKLKDDEIISLKESFDELSKTIISNVRDEFSEWLENLKIEVLPLTLTQSQNSWNNYFSGKLPFPSKKNRKDLPDSIIFEAISENFSEDNKLVFISEDGNLKNELRKLGYVENFTDLDSFILDKKFQDLLTEPPHIFIEKRVDDLKIYLEENRDLIDDLFVKEIKKHSNDIELSILNIHEFNNDEFYDFSIDYIEMPYLLNKINFTSINYYGDSKIRFNATFEVSEASVSFFMDKISAFNYKYREDDPDYDLYKDEIYDDFYINDSSSYDHSAEVIQEFSSIIFKVDITLKFNFKEKELKEFIDAEDFNLEVDYFFKKDTPFKLEAIENIEIETYDF